jgi:hypothetical protein
MPMSDASGAVSSKTQGGVVSVENTRGTAHMSRLRPGALLYLCAGTLSADFYEPMVKVAQREVDLNGGLLMVVDGWDLASVDSGFREQWTLWFKAHKEHFRMRLLVRTKLMEMAASLANLFTGINVITTYSNVGVWERAVALEVPGFRRPEAPAA